MSQTLKARVRKTPNGRHLYTATYRGVGTYGWGNTPDEARAKRVANYAASLADRAAA